MALASPKTNVTIITRSEENIGYAIRHRRHKLALDLIFAKKRIMFSVYRFGETDTYLICLGKLSDAHKADLNVSVYQEDIVPFYPLRSINAPTK